MSDDGLKNFNITEIQEAEATAFSEQINKFLRHDEELKNRHILPITDPTTQLVKHCRDGILLSRMIHMIQPNAIALKSIKLDVDVKKLNIPGCKDAWEIANNNNIVLEGAKALGCKMVNIGHEDLLAGNTDLILGLVWQLIRAYLMKSVNLSSHPELIRLMKPNENILKLMNLSAEEIIIRWFNYHLVRAGSTDVVKNFGADMKDCSKWVTLIKQVCGRDAEDAGIDEVMAIADLTERAQKLLDVAEELACADFTSPKDIVKGHARLNLAFTATIFNEHIGIRLPTEDEIDAIYEQLEEVRQQLAACREDCAHKAQLIGSVDERKKALQDDIKEFEKELEVVDTDVVVKESETRNTKREKTTELNRLVSLKGDKENALNVLKKTLAETLSESQSENAEKQHMISEQLAKIQQLELVLARLDAEKQDMAEKIEGRGAHLADMTEKLLNVESHVHDLTRFVSDHVKNSADILNTYGAKLRKPCRVSVSDDEQQALQDSWNGLEQVLTGYILEINEADMEFAMETAINQQRLDEINGIMKEFLNDGQVNLEDGISELKRLLGLLINKNSSQGTQIHVLEDTIRKKEELAEVMADKVRVIAEKAVEQQKQVKKKRTFFS